MKRFTISCDFVKRSWPFHIYVGQPAPDKHPLQNQANWLSRERDGSIPVEVWDSFQKLHDIAKKYKVPFADLCTYAWRTGSSISSKKTIAMFKQLHGELPQLERGGELVRESPESTNGKHRNTNRPNATQTSPRDSLLGKTHGETASFIFETGKMLWHDDDERSSISRLLFLGIGLYIASVPEKILTLSEIYRTITSDDPCYSLAVALDASGKTLAPLAYSLIAQWLNCQRWLREKAIIHVTATLTDFAMSDTSKRDSFDALRKGLYESVFRDGLCPTF